MKLSQETIHNIVQANLNGVSGNEEYIAGMICNRLQDGQPLQLGDIVYGYYTQTDGFTIYDVVKLNEDHALIEEIDSDCMFDENNPTVDTTPLIVGPTRFNTFYRPNPEDRKLVENEGFESASFSRFGGGYIEKRKLAIKIHQTQKETKETKEKFNYNYAIIAVLLLITTITLYINYS